MILEIETATNILDALDGVDILSNATIRTAKAAGAERLHSMFRERMIADGWSRGAKHYTDRESKTTPHVDEWTTFTDGQRTAFANLCDAKISPTPRTKSTDAPETASEIGGSNE